MWVSNFYILLNFLRAFHFLRSAFRGHIRAKKVDKHENLADVIKSYRNGQIEGGKDEPHRCAPLVAKGGGHDEVVPLPGPLLEDGRTIRGDEGRGVGDVARGTGPFTQPPDGHTIPTTKIARSNLCPVGVNVGACAKHR